MMRRCALALSLALALSACAGQPTPQSPAQSVYAAKVMFLAALDIADRYVALPRCPATPVCADTAVVQKILTAADAAATALDSAQSTVTDPAFAGGSQAQQAAVAAQNAVIALSAITSQLTIN